MDRRTTSKDLSNCYVRESIEAGILF